MLPTVSSFQIENQIIDHKVKSKKRKAEVLLNFLESLRFQKNLNSEL
jgi:hypothetical protein